jgi:2-succinyl-6-hydroxy-2,4-cyclohexadiene-1-carboxylate synthase
VVLLHGFTQTGASMRGLADALSARHEVACADLPGHGASGPLSADLDETAALVGEAAGGEPFDLVGYSLGGRVALHVALSAPAGLRRVVALSASPGIADEAARASRLERDRALADALVADGDVAAFVARWLAAPMFANLRPDAEDLAARAANTAAGLADSLRRCSVGTQRWLGDELALLTVPLLCVAGAADDQFVAHAVGIAARTAAAGAVSIPGAGHACHLEQPGLTARVITQFLAPA